MRADFGNPNIADDGQRRVIPVVAVLVDLAIGFVEVFVFVFAFKEPNPFPTELSNSQLNITLIIGR